ncbi:MAG: SpvB and TcdB toxin domain protein [Bacteroidetes bacterium]|nr:MAG: SpvB and TcdB toxin domain protein [Bacteroidota bacterium]
MNGNDQWQDFVPFPNESLNDIPYRTEYVDLSGSNRSDELIITPSKLYYRASLGLGGMESVRNEIPNDTHVEAENRDGLNPFVFYGFADVYGDGLEHRVKIEDEKMTAWPNLGYGKFGTAISIPIAGFSILESVVDLHTRLVLADVSGSGTTDLVLVYPEKIQVFFNQSGASFSGPVDFMFGNGLRWSEPDHIRFADIAGNGNTCLVFSKNTPHWFEEKYSDTAHYYYEFNAGAGQGGKPFLLEKITNNMGLETSFFYKSSLKDYREAQKEGNPWTTKLPFPAIVLERSVVTDHISNTSYTSEYTYRNGFYDPDEHSFLGFGCVSHTDLPESFSDALTPPPTLTKQWFHTGMGTDEAETRKEFFQDKSTALPVPFSFIPAAYANDPEALLALAGSELHSEVYDAGDLTCPYAAASSSYEVARVQPPASKKRGVYRVFLRENISFNYEKRAEDPQVSHSFTLETDRYNQALKSCAIAYPRKKPLIEEQGILYCTAAGITLVNQDTGGLPRWIGIGLESKSFQVQGLPKPAGAYYTFDEIKKTLLRDNAFVNRIDYSNEVKQGATQVRLLSWQKQFYWNNGKQESAWDPHTAAPPVLLPHHVKSIVFDETNVEEILGDRKSEISFTKAGYVFEDGYWWARSAVTRYGTAAEFFLPQAVCFDWAEKSGYLYTESITSYDAYALFPIRSSARLNDETYLTTSAEMDYARLSPWRVTDPNGNRAEVLTDELGVVIASAVYEKDGTKNGDTPLHKYNRQETVDLKTALLDDPLKYIQGAGSFFHYEFARFENNEWLPAYSLSLARTVYKPDANAAVQRSITYNDGFGRVIESRQWAGRSDGKDDQWLVSGRVTYNAKGQAAASYAGSFSGTYRHETEAEWKTRMANEQLPPPTTFAYDAPGRQVQVNTPKGFFSRTLLLNAWEIQHFDENDTVLESPYYKSGKWKTIPEEKEAIEKATLFYNTPSAAVTDALGRQIIAVSDNGKGITAAIGWERTALASEDINPSDERLLVSWQQFDIQGRVLLQADARFHEENQKLPPAEKKYNFRYSYAVAAGLQAVTSADAGTYCSVSDVLGNQLTGWDALGVKQEIAYDNLQRPVAQSVKTPAGFSPALDQVITKTMYGETVPGAAEKNMLGRACAHFDPAGRATVPAYTFEGLAEKQLVNFRTDYKTEADWSRDELLEAETFTTQTAFDAAQRPISQTLPDKTVLTWQYGAMGNCVRSGITVAGKTTQSIVNDSMLNEFGQLAGVSLGNHTCSRFDYDPLTQLTRQVKLQKNDTLAPLQQLSYWHDPTGLITTMQNDVAATQFFNNRQVSPAGSYTYDALYRLLSAGGRMLAAKNNAPQNGRTDAGSTPGKIYRSGDLQAVENFTETYAYDKSNNLLQLMRTCSNGFARKFSVDTKSNRVNSYTQGDETYAMKYNAAGYQQHVNGEGSCALRWNSQGNISNVVMIAREDGRHDAEYYVYSSGIRVRKVTERLENGTITVEDKRYLGDYKRTVRPSGKQLHSITAGGVQKHDCVVQYSSDAPGDIMYRFQHGNHLDSVGMETNLDGEIISYEEYSPFGETVYSYAPMNLDSTKEYRYSAQEKDASTGLYYYGYRYYTPWLCRWTRPDPAGTVDGFNLYAFVGNEPVGRVDVMGLGKKEEKEKAIKEFIGKKEYSMAAFKAAKLGNSKIVKEAFKEATKGNPDIKKLLNALENQTTKRANKKKEQKQLDKEIENRLKTKAFNKNVLTELGNKTYVKLMSDKDYTEKAGIKYFANKKADQLKETIVNHLGAYADDEEHIFSKIDNPNVIALEHLELFRKNGKNMVSVAMKTARYKRAKGNKEKTQKLTQSHKKANRITFEVSKALNDQRDDIIEMNTGDESYSVDDELIKVVKKVKTANEVKDEDVDAFKKVITKDFQGFPQVMDETPDKNKTYIYIKKQ